MHETEVPKMILCSLCTIAFIAFFECSSGFAVVGYLPEWRYLHWPAHEQWRWRELCETVTHLIIFSIEVLPNGDFAALDRFPGPDLLANAVEAATATGTKLLLCFGGNSRTNGFPAMVATAGSRRRFIDKLVKFCLKKGLHGVDFNWEYPTNQQDWNNLYLLVVETKQKFVKHGFIITMAYYPDGAQENQLKQGFYAYVDLFLAMVYDKPQQHSTLEFFRQSLLTGVSVLPKEKVALGLPFYARNVQTGDWTTWENIVERNTHALESNPRLNQIGDDYFNGPDMIRKKTRLALENEIGGVMIWEIGQDHFDNAKKSMGSMSLLKVIASTIAENKKAPKKDL